jgi:hypothetical protein
VIVTQLGDQVALPDPDLCWVPMPDNVTRHCTNPDPLHDGDHEHEYSGVTWPRCKGDRRDREQQS